MKTMYSIVPKEGSINDYNGLKVRISTSDYSDNIIGTVINAEEVEEGYELTMEIEEKAGLTIFNDKPVSFSMRSAVTDEEMAMFNMLMDSYNFNYETADEIIKADNSEKILKYLAHAYERGLMRATASFKVDG